MSEAVAVPKPASTAKSGSGKTVFAGVMVFVLLVAFATAFYFLGGVDLVSGIVDGWFASAPPSSSSQQPPKSGGSAPAGVAPTGSTVATEAELKLPEGVDEAFAKRAYAEMLESQANITRLVDGEVASFAYGKVKVANDTATIPLKVTFKDKGKLSGQMVLAKKGGKWYLASVAADADVIDENSAAHAAETAEVEPDVAVLNAILEQEAANQDVITEIVNGTYTGFSCDGVTAGPGTASIDITLTGPKKASMKGRVLCISKDIDGSSTWFLTSFTKS